MPNLIIYLQARGQASIDKLITRFGDHALLRGISLGGMKKFLAFVRAKFDSGFFNGCEQKRFEDKTKLPAVTKFEDLTTTHVVYMLIKDPNITGSKRMADCPEHIDPSDVGPPAYFISRESLFLSDCVVNCCQSCYRLPSFSLLDI